MHIIRGVLHSALPHMYYCHIHTQRNKSNHGGSDGEVEVDGTAPPEATNSENHDQAMDQATEQSLPVHMETE